MGTRFGLFLGKARQAAPEGAGFLKPKLTGSLPVTNTGSFGGAGSFHIHKKCVTVI